MKIHATIEMINSQADAAGNRYWAFRYIDHKSGRSIVATISGGESNINGIRLHMGRVDGWDGGIQTFRCEMRKREFKNLTADWPYAGCDPSEIAEFVKKSLKTRRR